MSSVGIPIHPPIPLTLSLHSLINPRLPGERALTPARGHYRRRSGNEDRSGEGAKSDEETDRRGDIEKKEKGEGGS